MGKTLEFGCKKCGAVIRAEIMPRSNHIEIKLDNASAHDHFGTAEVKCKKCRSVVATVRIERS